jgi:hypothetical protein
MGYFPNAYGKYLMFHRGPEEKLIADHSLILPRERLLSLPTLIALHYIARKEIIIEPLHPARTGRGSGRVGGVQI